MNNGFGGFNMVKMADQHAQAYRMATGHTYQHQPIRGYQPPAPAAQEPLSADARQAQQVMKGIQAGVVPMASPMYGSQSMHAMASLMQGLQQLYTAFSMFGGGPSYGPSPYGQHGY